MAQSHTASKLRQPRAVSSLVTYRAVNDGGGGGVHNNNNNNNDNNNIDDSGTGTGGSSTSHGSSTSGAGSTSSGSLADRIRRFFGISGRSPDGAGAGSRIPRPSSGDGGRRPRQRRRRWCDVVRPSSAALATAAGAVATPGGSGGGDDKPRVRFADAERRRPARPEPSDQKSDSGCSSGEDKRTKYRKADEKFVPRHKTRAFGRKKGKVANVGPADYNYDETVSTLRYANRAKNIKNKAKINEDPKDALLRQFQKEIEELRKQLEDGGIDEDVSGSEYETDSDEEGTEADGSPKRRKKKKKGKGLSKEKMLEIEKQIEADRKKLESQKDMAEEEKRKVEEALALKEKELREAEEEQKMLNQRLAAIEKKIIVGGENLLEKAEEQERLLEQSARELEERRAKAEELRKALEEKEQVRLDIEEKYSNLQEEVVGKTKKLKKVWTMLMQAKSEIADLQQEHQREMEGLLENVRQLSRELRLQMLIMDSFIPPEYQEMIEQYVHWNEDIGEWQLKCVAYTGNNMRKQTPQTEKEKDKYSEPDLSCVYLAYTAEGAEEAMRPKTGKKSGRPKTANRPKTSKKKRREPNINDLLN